MARILFWTVFVFWICSFKVWPKKKPQTLFSTENIPWKILTCLFQGVSWWEKDLMLPVNIFLLTSTYPYVMHDKIINETMLLTSIPNSSRQITALQYHTHCVNCDIILFEQCYSSTLKPSLQLLHNSSAQYLQDALQQLHFFICAAPTIWTEFLHRRGKISNNLNYLGKKLVL